MSLSEMFILFFFGASFGSFISMLAHRIPREENIIWKRSYCPSCNSLLSLKDLIPIFSWSLLLGKCRYCRIQIPYFYLFNEIFMGIIFCLLFQKYNFSRDFVLFSSLAVILYTISVIDLKHYLIPDSLQVILFIHAVSFFYKALPFALINCLFYSIAGLMASILVKSIKKRQALGEGDLKFLFIVGFYLSYGSAPLFFFIAGMSGLILGLVWRRLTKQELIPFAPPLSIALYLSLLFEKTYDGTFARFLSFL